MKKLLAIFTAFVMLATTVLGAVPVGAENSDVSVETGNDNLTVEGTNGFGDLLSEDILESQEESDEEYKEGYTVTDIVIEGNTAIVTYDSLEAANLVVALYTEDMVQMICSANTVVDPESTTATVTFEGDMPQYFMAAAYLMDTYDMSPLCPMYDTPLYTKDMQDLLNSTVNDYDEELVLNLDESEETNFAVYSEGTIVIEGADGVNTVASVNDENLTYVIEDADDTVKKLAVGSVFVYPYGEGEMLIARVGKITVDGDTVTIIGADLEMEDVFSHVKIDGESYTPDMTVDTSTADEGVTYEGLVSDGPAARSLEGGGSGQVIHHFFKLEKESKQEGEHVDFTAKLKGSLNFQVSASINYYISFAKQHIEFRITPAAKSEITVSAKINCKIALGSFGCRPVPVVFIGFEPDVSFQVNGKAEASASFSATIGFGFYSGTGVKNLTTAPTLDASLKAEISLFFGIDLKPKLTIVEDSVAKFQLESLVGMEIKATLTGKALDMSTGLKDQLHACNSCLKADLVFKATLTGKIEFLNMDWLSASVDIGKFTLPVGSMYWSADNGDFGWGSCPNMEYKVTVTAYDSQKAVKEDVVLTLSDGQSANSNRNGTAVFYLKDGIHTVYAVIDGKAVEKTFTVSKSSQKVTIYGDTDLNISGDSSQNTSNELQNTQSKDDYRENVPVPEGLEYRITSDDEVTVTDYTGEEKKIVIPSKIEGCPVTRIGDYAFRYCDEIESITLPETLTRIGREAFSGCESLTSIIIPSKVTRIDVSAFTSCENLTEIRIPKSVEKIGYGITRNCNKLSSLTVDSSNAVYHSIGNCIIETETGALVAGCNKSIIPNDGSITSIWGSAFHDCMGLKQITIPNGVTSIGDFAFAGCLNLASVIIPKSVTNIDSNAFAGCEKLTSVSIPESLESIEENVFYLCRSLKSVTISESIRNICEYAFYGCESLTSIIIPKKVISIEDWAFADCTDLTSIMLFGDAPAISDFAFYNTTATAYYPADNPTWTTDVMQNYGGTLTWEPHTYNDPVPVNNTLTVMSADINDGISLMSVYPGEYGSEITDSYTLKTASFEGLAAGKDYVLLVLADMGAEDTLSADNLLYIGQGTALEDGTLTFKYVPKSNVDVSYVIACGPSNKDLKDATITFPEMEADGELAAVEPIVVYDGVTLTEGVDYVIVGTVDYITGGTYTCYIRGIYDYTGTVTCTYTVKSNFLPGDIDGDSRLTAMDSNLLKRIVAGATSAEGLLSADVNGDGTVNAIDSNILRRTIAGQ